MTDYLKRETISDQVTDLLESIPVENASLKTFHVGMSAQYANGRVIEMAATIDNSGAETGMSTSNHLNKKHGSIARTTKAFLKGTRINKD